MSNLLGVVWAFITSCRPLAALMFMKRAAFLPITSALLLRLLTADIVAGRVRGADQGQSTVRRDSGGRDQRLRSSGVNDGVIDFPRKAPAVSEVPGRVALWRAGVARVGFVRAPLPAPGGRLAIAHGPARRRERGRSTINKLIANDKVIRLNMLLQ